jgi:endonuclease/exonuclease/phosphatase family metal-dependent hydrolase
LAQLIPSEPQPTPSLRIASYNVHSCIGTDRRLDPRRIAAVLAELDADIVALQEVDAQQRRDGYLDQWIYLADAAGYQCIPGISLRTHRKTFGNALLSRVPLTSTRLHDLGVPNREPRGAIDVMLDFAGRSLRIVATHLGLKRTERYSQSKMLGEVLASEAVPGTVLVGDLNEWRRKPESWPWPNSFTASPNLPTFPSRWPLLALDRIVATGSLQLSDVTAHRSPLARRASDHLPLRATLRWAEAE